jgi:DNA-binding response OmpR family regulator
MAVLRLAAALPLACPAGIKRGKIILLIKDTLLQRRGGRSQRMNAARTILLVDDDPEIIESMRATLENRGYRVIVARDGNAGLAVAERENPDLVVLDMMMPRKSGFLVLEKLKNRPGGLIPTIMITANEGSRHRAYAEFLGVRDYIRKPFAMEKLVRAVDRVLGVGSAGAEEEH